jgi:quinol monooxygenase YgiN
MASEDLVFFVQLHLKPERVEEWRRAATELIDRMSREEAFVTCLLDRSRDDPTRFTLYERWREPSPEAFLAHQMTEYRKRYEALLPELLQAPRTTLILRPVAAWGSAASPESS